MKSILRGFSKTYYVFRCASTLVFQVVSREGRELEDQELKWRKSCVLGEFEFIATSKTFCFKIL